MSIVSKYSEGGVLMIPGLHQHRTTSCCLACSFKDIGVGDTIMEYIASVPLFFYQVYQLQDSTLKAMINKTSTETQRAVFAVCANLREIWGLYNVRSTHLGYYQLVTFDVEWIFNEDHEPVHIGKLQRGNFLQLFETVAISEMTFEILEKLKKDCTKVIKPSHQYQNLPITIRDTCITIKVSSQRCEVTEISGNVSRTESFKLAPGRVPFKDLLEHIYITLMCIPNVSMIVIDCCGVAETQVLIMEKWVNFLTRAYGFLDDLVIIIVFAYEDFTKNGIFSKAAVRTMVNFDEDEKCTDQIFWLDVTSVNDSIPELPGTANLEIKRLN